MLIISFWIIIKLHKKAFWWHQFQVNTVYIFSVMYINTGPQNINIDLLLAHLMC